MPRGYSCEHPTVETVLTLTKLSNDCDNIEDFPSNFGRLLCNGDWNH